MTRLDRKHRIALARLPGGETPKVRRSWKRETRKILRQMGRILLAEQMQD